MAKAKTENRKDAAQTAPEAEQAMEQTTGQEAPEAAPEPNGLTSLDVLADRHRVPAWQHAALLRLTGWADDKQVTDADYQKALDNLKVRRIGGGRG